MKKFKVPHAYALLFVIVVICTILTWIIPAGEYSTYVNPTNGATYIKPDSFHYVEPSPVGIFEMFGAIPRGLVSGAEIIFFLFIVGGAFGVVEGTGAFKAGINTLATSLKNREILLVAITTIIFSAGGALFGLAEQVLALIPVSLLLCRTLKLDRMVAVAMLMVGSQAGFSAGMFNPYTVAVGQKIAELPMFSGKEFRLLGCIVLTAITVGYLVWYCRKIKADPKASLSADLEENEVIDHNEDQTALKLTIKHKAALGTAVLAIAILVWGVSTQSWYLKQLSYLFFAMAVVAGAVGGSGFSKTAEDFVKGAETLTMGALIVGVAKGIVVVLTDGKILATIISFFAAIITMLPDQITVLGMYAVQNIVNFFVPSGSGQAMATLPIMLPLGDMAGITRQTTVVCMEYGAGLTNIVFPTTGLCMGALGIAKIPYERWVKWVFPLITMWIVAGAILLLIANAIRLGPF